ncbi:MAG: hypothetical protein ACLTFB_02600 [Candidatus Phytoplasma pyri]|uniref:hypothetical protein n=1 Tax=Candidatus Phytoplasma pyri TaxID=47566 RepID=UPI003983A1C8
MKRKKILITIKMPHSRLLKKRWVLPPAAFSNSAKNKYSRSAHKKATAQIYQDWLVLNYQKSNESEN